MMSDSERTPMLPTQVTDTPQQRTISDSPVPPADLSPVISPQLTYSGETVGGYISRDTFKRIYSLLSVLYGFLNVGVWVSLSVTIYYLHGTSGYYAAVMGLAAQMIVPVVQCASIGSRVTSVGYKHSARLGLKTLINIHLCFLVLLLTSSVACIVISSVNGIRYGDHGEEVTNKDTNVALGVLNVATSSIVAIVTSMALYFAAKLRNALILANVNSGPFAIEESYSE